jgi:hypothetical protein
MSKYASALNRARVLELPNTYHRAQGGGGVKVQLRRKFKDFDTFDREWVQYFENPDVNLLKAFKPVQVVWDNRGIVRAYVEVFNRNVKVKRDHPNLLHQLRLLYYEDFEQYNLCWKCLCPIKTQSSKAVKQDLPLVGPLLQSRANEPVKTTRRGVTPSKIRKRWNGREDRYEKHEVFVKPKNFRAFHYRYRGSVTQTYADVVPHFQVFQTDNGKWIFAFVDGTKVLKGIKSIDGKDVFFELNTGKLLPDYKPPVTYRVFSVKCGCPVR